MVSVTVGLPQEFKAYYSTRQWLEKCLSKLLQFKVCTFIIRHLLQPGQNRRRGQLPADMLFADGLNNLLFA